MGGRVTGSCARRSSRRTRSRSTARSTTRPGTCRCSAAAPAATTVVHEKAVGVVATSWRHTTARAVEDQVPDPQLHSHVLLHAAVRRDGRLVAIDSRSWLVHQREVGAAYRTELARELDRLGFMVQRGTGRGGRYFEIDGVPQGLLDRWSSRHHQVRSAIRATHRPNTSSSHREARRDRAH